MEKRFFSLILALVLILLALAACGDQPGENSGASDGGFRIITATPRATGTPTITPTPRVPELAPGALDGVEVTFWYASDSPDQDILQQAAGWFNAENEFGIKVTVEQFETPNELTAAVEEGIATNRMPNVVLVEPYQYLLWQDAGKIVDLAPYLEHPVYGLPLEIFYAPMIERDRYPAGQMGFPGRLSAQVILYNQSWGRELGFEAAPRFPEEFSQQACAAHLANGDQTGGWLIDTSPGGAAAWLLAFDRGQVTQLNFKSGNVEAAYSFLYDMYQSGCAWQPAVQYPDDAFASRQGLFYAVNTREIGYVAEAFAESGIKDVWTVIGYPNPEGEPVITLAGQSYVVLASDRETQIASWLFIRYMAGENSQAALAEEGLYFPLDSNTAARLAGKNGLPEAWRDGLTLLEDAVAEPALREWGVVRSVLQDAQAEVLNVRFTPGTISLFLDQLDKLIAELSIE